jgi:hypothetical protein
VGAGRKLWPPLGARPWLASYFMWQPHLNDESWSGERGIRKGYIFNSKYRPATGSPAVLTLVRVARHENTA